AEDTSALAKAISDLLSDKERRHRMGEAGKKMCLPYSAEAMVEQIDDLYKDLLAKYSNNRDTKVRFLLDKKTEEFK
ncbi:MAG: hypothetical protein PVH81_13575, partial [Syntrophobacterales bacterium]